MDCCHCGASNRDEDEFCRKCGKCIQDNKDVSNISKLKVGWMVWWRAMLPVEVLVGVLVGWMQANSTIANLVMLPFLFLLLNWAGKVVTRKKYGFDPLYAGSKNLAIGFTVVPIPAIGWGIFWRALVISIPLRLFVLGFSGFAAGSGNIFLLLLQICLWPIYIFLMIIVLGWAAKRTIEPIKASME